MVSSSEIRSGYNSIDRNIDMYEAIVEDAGSLWQGVSADEYKSISSSFLDEYRSTISEQFQLLSEALDLYESYSRSKKNIEITDGNIDIAKQNKKDGDVAKFRNDKKHYLSEKNGYERKINAKIEAAKNMILDADVIEYKVSSNLKVEPISIDLLSMSSTSSSVLSSSNESKSSSNNSLSNNTVSGNTVSTNTYSKPASEVNKAAVDWIVSVANDDSHGYSQKNRFGNPDFDCSSLIITAMYLAGADTGGAISTWNMRNAFLSTGKYDWIPGNPSVEDLKPGDVLLAENGHHTEMYVGNGKNVGAVDNYDGEGGDSSGGEIKVYDYSRDWNWDGVLRYKG